MNSDVVKALRLQIAEDMVPSCIAQCENHMESKTILDLLDENTMNRIINKIKDDGGYVKFKKNWMGFSPAKAAMNTPLFSNEKAIEFVKSFFPHLADPPALDAICASKCNVQVLSPMIKETMDSINDIMMNEPEPKNVFAIINNTFELKKPPTGGRKQKSRRGHKQMSRRGHKTRHSRRSTRKH